jgi:hypothetical protein
VYVRLLLIRFGRRVCAATAYDNVAGVCAATAWLGELLHAQCSATDDSADEQTREQLTKRIESGKELWSVHGMSAAVRRTVDRFIWNSPYAKIQFVVRILALVGISIM